MVLSLVSCILGVCPRDLVSRNMSSTTRLFGHLLLRQRCRIIHGCRQFYERVLPSLENQAQNSGVSPVLTMQTDLCHPQQSLCFAPWSVEVLAHPSASVIGAVIAVWSPAAWEFSTLLYHILNGVCYIYIYIHTYISIYIYVMNISYSVFGS